MMRSAQRPGVLPFRLPSIAAQQRIREIAADTSNIDWSLHALERMEQRGIDDVDVLRVLRGGFVTEAPEPAREGEWKCKITKSARGSREIGVVTIIVHNNRLFVKTVEWEDQR